MKIAQCKFQSNGTIRIVTNTPSKFLEECDGWWSRKPLKLDGNNSDFWIFIFSDAVTLSELVQILNKDGQIVLFD